MIEVKCKKCRKVLLNQQESLSLTINAHSEVSNESLRELTENICETIKEHSHLYLREEYVPSWIKTAIEDAKWSKGRINCPFCNSRLGGFDFVSGIKCHCSEHILPPVHMIKSKIDVVTISNLK